MSRGSNSGGTVLTLLALAGVVVVAGQARKGQPPSVGQAVGATLSAVSLTALAGPAPKLATGFAGLVLVGALAGQLDLLRALPRLTTPGAAASRGTGQTKTTTKTVISA